MTTLLRFMPATLGLAMLAACGGDETTGGADHTPATYSILINEAPATAPYTFSSGETVRVRIKFFNASQADLDIVEAEHFGRLTFNPTSLATISLVAGHHFQFDVTGGTTGTGTMQVSYGHNASADEVSFEPAAVNVAP